MARTSVAPSESASVKRVSLMIGFHRAPGQVATALRSAGVKVCERTIKHVLRFVEPHGHVALATLGFASPYGLGLEPGAHPLFRIMAAAEARGLEPCPPEVGPTLRLGYENQPDGEWAIVATKSFCDDLGMVHFVVGNVGGQKVLRCEPADAAIEFKSDSLFVFLERLVPSFRA